MTSIYLFSAMFCAAFVVALAAVSLYWSYSEARAKRAGDADLLDPAETPAGGLLRSGDLSTIGLWHEILEHVKPVEALQRSLDQAGLDWSAGRFTLVMLLGGTSAGVLLLRLEWVNLPAALLISCLVAYIPLWWLERRRQARLMLFARLFPEALDSVARAMKAGHPLSIAIENIVADQPEPIAGEMRRARDEWRLGGGWELALANLADRVPIPEVRLFAAAVRYQNRSGGRLNDILVRLAEGMRENVNLESEIRSISAHSRMTGTALSLVPLGIMGMMLILNPAYLAQFIARPAGRWMLIAVLVMNVTAHFIIRRMTRPRF